MDIYIYIHTSIYIERERTLASSVNYYSLQVMIRDFPTTL